MFVIWMNVKGVFEYVVYDVVDIEGWFDDGWSVVVFVYCFCDFFYGEYVSRDLLFIVFCLKRSRIIRRVRVL